MTTLIVKEGVRGRACLNAMSMLNALMKAVIHHLEALSKTASTVQGATHSNMNIRQSKP
jgi:hypothetical protein